MTACFYNAKSVGRSEKRSEIELFVRDESIDALILSGTWLRCPSDEATCVDMAPVNYTMRSSPHFTRGRDAAFFLRDRILDNAKVTTAFFKVFFYSFFYSSPLS